MGIEDRAVEEPARADRARRAGDPARHLRGRFASAAGIAWNTDVERRFVSSIVPSPRARRGRRRLRRGPAGGRSSSPATATASSLAPSSREPLAPHLEGPANAFRRRHRMHGPFVLYGGRIDPGKGCEELLEYFQTYLQEGGDATLMLMGTKLMPLPDDPHVRFAGMLPDEERLHALEAATVVVVPSPYESLSLLALEAFAVGTPVLANARAEVLVDHCRRSNAGPVLRRPLGVHRGAEAARARRGACAPRWARNGKAYVNDHYRWSTILAKYERLFSAAARASRATTAATERAIRAASGIAIGVDHRTGTGPRPTAAGARTTGDRQRRRHGAIEDAGEDRTARGVQVDRASRVLRTSVPQSSCSRIRSQILDLSSSSTTSATSFAPSGGGDGCRSA